MVGCAPGEHAKVFRAFSNVDVKLKDSEKEASAREIFFSQVVVVFVLKFLRL